MYNAQLFKYKNSWQLRLYDFPISSSVITSSDKLDSFDIAFNEVDTSFVVDPDNKYSFDNRSFYNSVNHSKNKIFYYARSVDWSGGWFCTLTFNPELIDSFDYRSCVSALRYFLDRLKNYDNTLKYLFVPEKHDSGRFHFHGLISNIDLLRDNILIFSGHYFQHSPIYNFSRFWKWGFSNVTKIKDSLAVEKYITKYTTKELLQDCKYQHRYFVSQNLVGADIVKLSLDNERLTKKLLRSDLVLYCDTSGKYNRVKYFELKNDDEVLRLLDFYGIVNM